MHCLFHTSRLIRISYAAKQTQENKEESIMSMFTVEADPAARDQAVTDLIESVALAEAALSHILNAEGEKLQAALAMEDIDTQKLLCVNKSIQSMVDEITRLELVLQTKLKLVACNICPDEKNS